MSNYLFLSNEKNSRKLVVDVSDEEYCVLSAILHGEFDRRRGRYLRMINGCLKVDKVFMSYFEHFKTLFDKVESLRLGRFVEYSVDDGFHYDITDSSLLKLRYVIKIDLNDGNKSVSNKKG